MFTLFVKKHLQKSSVSRNISIFFPFFYFCIFFTFSVYSSTFQIVHYTDCDYSNWCIHVYTHILCTIFFIFTRNFCLQQNKKEIFFYSVFSYSYDLYEILMNMYIYTVIDKNCLFEFYLRKIFYINWQRKKFFTTQETSSNRVQCVIEKKVKKTHFLHIEYRHKVKSKSLRFSAAYHMRTINLIFLTNLS